MDFNFRGFDSSRHHNPLFQTSSPSPFSRHALFSDQPITGVWPMGRSVGPVVDMREAIEREIEKERIRSEILGEEIARQRLRREMMERDTMVMHNNGEFTSSYLLRPSPFSSHYNRLEPESNMHGGLFSREDIRRVMSSFEVHSGSDGSYRRDIGGFELVAFQRGPHSPKIDEITTYQPKDVNKEVIRLGQPFGAPMSGLKRKLPPSPSPSPAGGRSSELCSDAIKKKIEEWSCAVCQVSATSEQSLNDHLAGKKHQSKMAALTGSKNGGEIGLGKFKNSDNKQRPDIRNSAKSVLFDSKKDRKTEREKTKQKLKPWCRVCQFEAPDEKGMIKHKEGKLHLKNLLNRARVKNRSYRNKRF